MTKRKGGSVGLHLHVPLLQRLHYAVAGANNNSRFAFCITLLMSNFLRLSEIHVRLIVSMCFPRRGCFSTIELISHGMMFSSHNKSANNIFQRSEQGIQWLKF
jgi:hypothetical protein